MTIFEPTWVATLTSNGRLFYRGAIGTFDRSAFEDHVWICRHEHPTRYDAITCAEQGMQEWRQTHGYTLTARVVMGTTPRPAPEGEAS